MNKNEPDFMFDGYWYLAGPYSDSIDERYKQHLDATAILTRREITVYSPIVHYHPIAREYTMPTDAAFWEKHNFNMIRRSDGVILLCVDNWSASKGVRGELNFCKKINKPVWALDPPDYTNGNLNWTKML